MNPLPSDPLDLTILLYKCLQDRQLVDGQLIGRISFDFDFGSFSAALDSANLLISDDPKARTIESHSDKGFFVSLDDLLASPARRVTSPSRFYLADSDSLYDGDAAILAPKVQHYFAAAKLYTLLGKACDHQGGVGEAKTLIFLHKEKIEITPDYTIADIHELTGLGNFEAEFITSETHHEQKWTILKTVLFELFSGRKRLPFSDLLSLFDEFYEKALASYQLYVAEFSFQKVKEEVEKEKLDAMVKLNKVFSDVQGQLLAVPVALVLVGGQMEDRGLWSSKNLLIWLGAVIFSILMDLLIRNQKHTLKAVKNEIDQQRKQIEKKYQTIAPRFEEIYKEIDDRHSHQQWLIRIVDALVAISLGITSFLLIRFSS